MIAEDETIYIYNPRNLATEVIYGQDFARFSGGGEDSLYLQQGQVQRCRCINHRIVLTLLYLLFQESIC